MNMDGGFGSAPVALLLTVGILAICLTGFLSAVEVALGRLSRAYVEDLVEDNVKNSENLLGLVSNRNRSDLALRGARGTLQTVAIVCITVALVDIFNDFGVAWWVITLVALAGIGLAEFVLVSLVPWAVARRSYRRVALWGTPITTWLVRISWLFRPLFRVFDKVRDKDARQEPDPRLAVAEDLRELVDEVGEAESLDEEDKEILRSFFEMGQTLIREVMVPRTAMLTIDSDATLEEAFQVFLRSGYSRIPVIGKDIDDVIGILYLKDVCRKIFASKELASQPVFSHVRAASFIPETRMVDDELRAMQDSNTHLALVVDEYGGIAGLVTMEDIIEELVGEVTDEHDRHELEPEPLGNNTWRVPARFSLKDLEELLDVEIDEESVDSVGGLLAAALEQVPLPGATATVDGITLTADEEIGRRREILTIVVEGPRPRPGGETVGAEHDIRE